MATVLDLIEQALTLRKEDQLARDLAPFFLGGERLENVERGTTHPMDPRQTREQRFGTISEQRPPVDLMARYMGEESPWQGKWVEGYALGAGAEPETARKIDTVASLLTMPMMALAAKGTAHPSAVAEEYAPARIRPGLSLEENAVRSENRLRGPQTVEDLLKYGTRKTGRIRNQATEDVGGFADTSKLPCAAWGIPSEYCKTGGKLRSVPDSPCFDCYAAGTTGAGKFKLSMYGQENVKAANERRFVAYNDDPKKWAKNMAVALSTEPYFRWFDSGDLQSPEMLGHIIDVARATPGTKHWLPTKERPMVDKWMRDHPGETIPDNLTIRISLPRKDIPTEGYERKPNAYMPSAMFPVAGEYSIGRAEEYKQGVKEGKVGLCPAPMQGGACNPATGAGCRRCFQREDVTYLQH